MVDVSGTWTDERVEQLKKLWSDGLSASQIATEIGNVTRNAVIGKVHRLGLSGRTKTPKPSANGTTARTRKTTRAPSAPTPISAPVRDNVVAAPIRTVFAPVSAEIDLPIIEDDVGLPNSERVTIMELRESMCRWPMGDPTKPEFRFCGARSTPGVPYCSHHAQIAYQPVADRRRDRRVARA